MASIELLLLDCHGIVLNDPFGGFLAECGRLRGLVDDEARARWKRELRAGAWLGHLSDAELWIALRGESFQPDSWARTLEPRYAAGPAASELPRWRARVPVWLLTNHRGAWLRPRLARFGLARHFDHLLISDELGVMKPDPEAFLRARRLSGATRILFVDNTQVNIDAAERAGLRSLFAHPERDWIAEVDRVLAES